MTSARWPPSGTRMSNRVDDLAAVILRRREWRNTSLILDVFTREQGCLGLVARGARKSRSRADFEPFVLLSLGYSGDGNLKTLTTIEGQSLGVDAGNYPMLLYVNELLLNLLPREEPASEVFDAYLHLLQHARARLDEPDLRGFEMLLLRELGYLPDLAIDADSGLPIDPARNYRYLSGNGFVACGADDADAVTGELLLAWQRQDYREPAVRRLARSVMRAMIDFNLHGKTLKSREVYARMVRRGTNL